MKNQIEPVLQMEDIAKIFRVSIPTVNRWLQDAKRCKNDFPLPINTPGRKLTWNRDLVEEYLNRNIQIAEGPHVESAAKQRKRHNEAMIELERKHGLTIKSRKGKEATE